MTAKNDVLFERAKAIAWSDVGTIGIILIAWKIFDAGPRGIFATLLVCLFAHLMYTMGMWIGKTS